MLLISKITLFLLKICFDVFFYFRSKGSIYLVFEFCAHDLAGLLSNATVKFTLGEIKKARNICLLIYVVLSILKIQVIFIILEKLVFFFIARVIFI